MGRKNKKGRGVHRGGRGGGAGRGPGSGSALGSFGFWTDIPTFHAGGRSGRSADQHDVSGADGDGDGDKDNFQAEGSRVGGGMYLRYKRATASVRDFLQRTSSSLSLATTKKTKRPDSSLAPSAKLESVNDLSRAAERIYDSAVASVIAVSSSDSDDKDDDATLSSALSEPPIDIPKRVLEDLDVSISLREKVGEAYGRCGAAGVGGDKGHLYMLSTLKYVRKVLSMSRRIGKVYRKLGVTKQGRRAAALKGTSSIGVDSEIGGKFDALAVDDDKDDDDEGIDEDMIRSGNLPRVRVPEPDGPRQARLSIDNDLIKGDDRFQAILFLLSLDNFMGAVDAHFGLLKSEMRSGGACDEDHASAVPQLLMECAVVVNAATSSVRSMESALAFDHGHLSSFYHILAVVFLTVFTEKIDEEIPHDVRRDRPALSKEFVGEVVECAFRNRGDVHIPGVVDKFAKLSKVPRDILDKKAEEIRIVTLLESQTNMEALRNSGFLSMCERTCGGSTPHSWFSQWSAFLGGDRSIINTQKVVQLVLNVTRKGTKLVPKGNYFGPMWNESNLPAKMIRGDMDELLASDILPELIEASKRAPIRSLPNHRELFPIFDLLAEQMLNPKRPVPVSLTFGLHAILTSMFVLQGDGDVARLAAASKGSWERLFQQLEAQSNTKLPQPPTFFANVNTFKRLVRLAEPVGPAGTLTSETNSFWNPVCAGSYLLFGTYICSLGLGSATVDSFGQLRFALHLYNASKVCGLIDEGGIPLLSNLDRAFENTKAVWVTRNRPKRGEFMKSFLIAWGHAADVAAKKVDNARQMHLASRIVATKESYDISVRRLDEIKPEHFSQSYRRLITNDFSDAVDDYSLKDATDAQRRDFGDFLDFLSRVNMIRDAMDEDEVDVIPFNFVEVGGVLNEFICSLSKEMGWDKFTKEVIALMSPDEIRNSRGPDGRKIKGFFASDANLERIAVAQLISSLLGEADFSVTSQPKDLQKAVAFMKSFFTKDTKNRCIFFVEPSEESHKKEASTDNPLLGRYPYGRTGRTRMDPLRAFWFFKLTKAGQPKVRLVKPGKRTPLVSDPSTGEIVSPYRDPASSRGNILQRQANGRYRHIASYSLKELVELGWDGAKYMSTETLGVWAPFVPGYDSDPDDDYDPVNIAAGKRAGLLGLSSEDIGLYMEVPSQGLVQLQKGK